MQYKRFPRYRPQTKPIQEMLIKVNKGHQKAHLHPLRDMCVQYENNPANAFRDFAWKLNSSSLSIKVNNGLKIEGHRLAQRS